MAQVQSSPALSSTSLERRDALTWQAQVPIVGPMAIAGGFLVLVARGSGAWAIDALRKSRDRRPPGGVPAGI
jgi:hypothetical protein